MKTVTGDDQVSADRKHKTRINFVPYCKVNIDSNDAPRFDDETRGFTRRFRRVNTPFYFVDEPNPNDPTQKKKDDSLHIKRTIEEELSGYLNVLIARSQEIVENRVYPSCDHLTQGYEKQVYSVDEFKDQFCLVGDYDETQYVSSKELYEAFAHWATLANSSIMNKNSFGRTFGALTGINSQTKTDPATKKSQKVYCGVGFKRDVFNQAINDLTTRLNGGNNGKSKQCENLSRRYQELKKLYGE